MLIKFILLKGTISIALFKNTFWIKRFCIFLIFAHIRTYFIYTLNWYKIHCKPRLYISYYQNNWYFRSFKRRNISCTDVYWLHTFLGTASRFFLSRIIRLHSGNFTMLGFTHWNLLQYIYCFNNHISIYIYMQKRSNFIY